MKPADRQAYRRLPPDQRRFVRSLARLATTKGYLKASAIFFVLIVTPGAIQLAGEAMRGETVPSLMQGVTLGLAIGLAGAMASPALLLATAFAGGWLVIRFQRR